MSSPQIGKGLRPNTETPTIQNNFFENSNLHSQFNSGFSAGETSSVKALKGPKLKHQHQAQTQESTSSEGNEGEQDGTISHPQQARKQETVHSERNESEEERLRCHGKISRDDIHECIPGISEQAATTLENLLSKYSGDLDTTFSARIVFPDDLVLQRELEEDVDRIQGVISKIEALPSSLEKGFEDITRRHTDTLQAAQIKLLCKQSQFDVYPSDNFRHWLNINISSMQLKQGLNLYQPDNSERWWPINVWGRVFDDLIQTMPNMILQRCVIIPYLEN